MTSLKPNARDGSRRRVRKTLWLASALAIAAPVWLGAGLWLLHGTPALVAGLAPVVAYLAWRVYSELTAENEIGVSPLDRVWALVELHLPNAEVRRAGIRAVRTVGVFFVLLIGGGIGVLIFRPKAPPPAPRAPTPTLAEAPKAESDGPIEPRLVPGLFALKVDSFPQMTWPAYGTIASFYGPDNPYGMDIYVSEDAKALAVGKGTVVYAADDICCGYGYTVVVKHEGGWVTTYGHLATLAVKTGDRVNTGDTLGAGGASPGDSQRLHFQAQRDGRSHDPLQVLPASQMGLPPLPAANQICSSDPLLLDVNSVVNLALTSTALRGYQLSGASVTPASEGAAPLDAGVVGLLSLVMQIPPSGNADYVLHLTLHKPGDVIAIDCAVAVREATDVPLSVAPLRREFAVETPTPFGGAPTVTSTVTPEPSVTPTPLATPPAATSRPAIRTLPSPTPFGGGQRLPFTPTPTLTPAKGSPLKPLRTPTPSPTPTPARPPTQTIFPKSYESLTGTG